MLCARNGGEKEEQSALPGVFPSHKPATTTVHI